MCTLRYMLGRNLLKSTERRAHFEWLAFGAETCCAPREATHATLKVPASHQRQPYALSNTCRFLEAVPIGSMPRVSTNDPVHGVEQRTTCGQQRGGEARANSTAEMFSMSGDFQSCCLGDKDLGNQTLHHNSHEH